jgi:hypothetical protein
MRSYLFLFYAYRLFICSLGRLDVRVRRTHHASLPVVALSARTQVHFPSTPLSATNHLP